MTIIDHPSPNHSERKAGVRVDTVLIHHTATQDMAPAVDWLCARTSGVSAHYVVGLDGSVIRLVPEHLKAWHAGKARMPWETCEPYDFNHRSIGIEVVNPGDGVTPFTEAQYRALEWLVPDVVLRLGTHVGVWPAGDVLTVRKVREAHGADEQNAVYVLGHRDVAPGRKTDPADNVDWGRIRKALAGSGT